MTARELIAAAELDALIDRLHALADPAQTAVPAFADTDWRSLAYRCATVIQALCAQAAAAGDGAQEPAQAERIALLEGALRDLLGQVRAFVERYGEADFETCQAIAALKEG